MWKNANQVWVFIYAFFRWSASARYDIITGIFLFQIFFINDFFCTLYDFFDTDDISIIAIECMFFR